MSFVCWNVLQRQDTSMKDIIHVNWRFEGSVFGQRFLLHNNTFYVKLKAQKFLAHAKNKQCFIDLFWKKMNEKGIRTCQDSKDSTDVLHPEAHI